MSSIYSHPYGLVCIDNKWCFRTQKEKNPYVIIDIGYSSLVKKINLYNRFDAHKDRASSLTVSVGNDINDMVRIAVMDKIWGENDYPIVCTFGDGCVSVQMGDVFLTKTNLPFVAFRYIFLSLVGDEFFHLGKVEIIEHSYLRFDPFSTLRIDPDFSS